MTRDSYELLIVTYARYMFFSYMSFAVRLIKSSSKEYFNDTALVCLYICMLNVKLQYHGALN